MADRRWPLGHCDVNARQMTSSLFIADLKGNMFRRTIDPVRVRSGFFLFLSFFFFQIIAMRRQTWVDGLPQKYNKALKLSET